MILSRLMAITVSWRAHIAAVEGQDGCQTQVLRFGADFRRSGEETRAPNSRVAATEREGIIALRFGAYAGDAHAARRWVRLRRNVDGRPPAGVWPD